MEIEMIEAVSERSLPASSIPAGNAPSKIWLWVLSILLAGQYIGLQLLVSLPVLIWALLTMPELRRDRSEIALMHVRPLLWATLIGVGVGVAAVLVTVLVWPVLLERLFRAKHTLAEWVGWRNMPLAAWLIIPPMTLMGMIPIVFMITVAFGAAEVNIQEAMFSDPQIQLGMAILGGSLVPVVEELIFRGALYNALSFRIPGLVGWQREIIPVLGTAIGFAAVHIPAGFTTIPAFLQIFVLSLFLSTLRGVTGSVKASILGHFTWNLFAVVMFLLVSILGITSP
jgi:membrane protease YdiL (CAAX protease family)